MLIWHGWSHLSLSPCTVLFRTHSLHFRLGLAKLNTTVGLLPIVCRDTWVHSRALTALGLLQLGSRVWVCVSKDLLYLRSLPHFIYLIWLCIMCVLTLKTQTAANIKFPGYFIKFKYYFLWSFLGIRTDMKRELREHIIIIAIYISIDSVLLRSLNKSTCTNNSISKDTLTMETPLSLNLYTHACVHHTQHVCYNSMHWPYTLHMFQL